MVEKAGGALRVILTLPSCPASIVVRGRGSSPSPFPVSVEHGIARRFLLDGRSPPADMRMGICRCIASVEGRQSYCFSISRRSAIRASRGRARRVSGPGAVSQRRTVVGETRSSAANSATENAHRSRSAVMCAPVGRNRDAPPPLPSRAERADGAPGVDEPACRGFRFVRLCRFPAASAGDRRVFAGASSPRSRSMSKMSSRSRPAGYRPTSRPAAASARRRSTPPRRRRAAGRATPDSRRDGCRHRRAPPPRVCTWSPSPGNRTPA